MNLRTSRPITDHGQRSHDRAAFTLVELLVVIAVIGVLVALLLPAISAVRETARTMQCSSRMRQIGTAIHTYADSHQGKFPKVSGHGTEIDESWIFALEPHLEGLDSMRLCPVDPEAEVRRGSNLTSYVLNGYLTVAEDERDHESEDIEHDDDEHGHDDEHDHDHDPPAAHEHEHDHRVFQYLSKLKSASTTIVLVEAAIGAHVDHVDSFRWFGAETSSPEDIFDAVSREIAVQRHSGSFSNFLFADNHVEAIDSEQIHAWCESGEEHRNFMHPQ